MLDAFFHFNAYILHIFIDILGFEIQFKSILFHLYIWFGFLRKRDFDCENKGLAKKAI